jgi:uncharacterized phage-associated protein
MKGESVARGTPFNREKFEELIVYIAKRLGPEAALGRVKLAKLLMLSDFAAYQRLGKPITGATYEKWEHGHFPRELVMAEKDLGDDGDGSITMEEVDYYGKRLRHINARRDPDLSGFSEDELGIIEQTLLFYGYESASYLRALSHREIGWELAEDREVIPYGTGLIGSRPPESVFEEFRTLYGIAS